MDFKLSFAVCLVIFIQASIAYDKDKEDFFKDKSDDEYYDFDEENDYSEEKTSEDKFRLNDKHLKFEVTQLNETQQDEEPTESPEAKYEVTERVEDIPNNTTVIGPIITNFTLTIPLNNATIVNVSNANNTDTDNNDNKETPSVKRNYISIFHIKAEYDNKPDITVIQNNRPNFPVFNGFKDYIKGVRQGIINGLQSFINNNSNNNQTPSNNANIGNTADGKPDIHNIVNAPVVFWNKLQSKNSVTVDAGYFSYFFCYFLRIALL